MIASIGVTYLGAEAAFSLVGLRYVPLRLQGALPEDIRVFAQSSKTGVVPRDPVLLLGDSYAQGYGDWLLETDPNRNGSFHSAHVIHETSGRDVITLGVSGAGSAEGMAAFPAIAYAHAEQAWYLRLPPPQVAIVYFYEGNDLNDNMTFLERRVENPDAADLVERVDRSIAAYPSALAVDTDRWRHFPLLRFSVRMVQRIFAGPTSTTATPGPGSDNADAAQADQSNVVEVAGRAMALPPNLQSPSLELTRPELERAVLVYERSLAFLRKLLAGTPVLVVYLPSPLCSYRLLGPQVSSQQYVAGRATRYPRERVEEYSNAICHLIRSATIGQGAGFLDLRPAVRAASAHDLLHGPRDFKHFNRKGMEVLGQAVAERIGRPLVQDSCSQGAN
jgi:lysophospholipase L1-like esterase